MKPTLTLTTLLLALAAPGAFATEQILVPWNHVWQYFQTMSDDPSVDDATIDNSGAGFGVDTGPDLIHPNFNTGATAWFTTDAVFNGAGGYAATFPKGFNIDGTQAGNPAIHSTYDGGQGAGPFGYGGIVYFGRTDIAPEMTAFGTPLTTTPTTRRFASYYRTTVTVAQDFAKPRIRMLLDDNAVIYYDGVAVARVNRDNSNIAYNDVAATDTTATNNEEGLTDPAVAPAPNNGNENGIQSFPLDVAGGPGRATLTPGARADSFVTVSVPTITAGTHTIAIVVRNNGNDSSDMCMAFQLLGDDAGIAANVGLAVRNHNGTANLFDDTFTVPVTVTKTGTASASWTSSDTGNPTGAYATPIVFGPYSCNATVPITFTSAGHVPLPELTTSVTLVPPFLLGMSTLSGSPVPLDFALTSPWTEVPARPMLQINNTGNVLAVQETAPIALTAGTPKCITVDLEHTDASTGSNSEVGDSIKVELVTDVGTFNLTAPYDSDGTSTNNGSALNGEDDANLTNGDELNPDSLPEPYTFTAHWTLAGLIPDTATTATIRVTGVNDSGTEFLRFGDIQLTPCVDTDGDGALDMWEAVAGTNPADPASVFREVSHAIIPGSAAITVSSDADRTYQMYSSTDLLSWGRETPVGAAPLLWEMNVPGIDADLTITRPHADPNRQFWKIIVHRHTTDISSP